MQEGQLLSAHQEFERVSQRMYLNRPLENEERKSHLRWRESMCKGQGAIQEGQAQSTTVGLLADPESMCGSGRGWSWEGRSGHCQPLVLQAAARLDTFSAENRGSLPLQEEGLVGQVGGSWIVGGKNVTLARSLKLLCGRGEMNLRSGWREARHVDERWASPGNGWGRAGDEGGLREDSAFASSGLGRRQHHSLKLEDAELRFGHQEPWDGDIQQREDSEGIRKGHSPKRQGQA